jgi:ferritin
MLNKKVEDAINDQINAELYSAYLYYSMAAYFEARALGGMAHWMRMQAIEEMGHANKFFNYVNERAGRVTLTKIDAPDVEWESPLKVFQAAYEHETVVSARINKLMDLAMSQSDHATANLLQWFVAEQVEEEATADDIVQKLKMVASTEGGMFLLDQELGKRPVVLPPELGGAA